MICDFSASPPCLFFEPVLLMIVPNYVFLSFSLFTIKMVPKADCLLLSAVNLGLPSEAQLDDCVLSSWVKCCLIALQAPAVSRGDHETRSPSQQQ